VITLGPVCPAGIVGFDEFREERLYRRNADGVPKFIEAGAPTDDQIQAVLQTLVTRLMKLFTRQGVLEQDLGETWLAELETDGGEARTLRLLQAAALTYRIAFGPRAGHKC